jgi:hypothetical protein
MIYYHLILQLKYSHDFLHFPKIYYIHFVSYNALIFFFTNHKHIYNFNLILFSHF